VKPVCVTCGTQFQERPDWPEHCPICEDERQYVGLAGQQWTTVEQLSREFHLSFAEEEPALTSFSISPKFGIGQRAFLVETPEGNLLWDCISLLSEELAEFIGRRGGLTAIAISHPHYYTNMVDWSERFGGVPIYLHEDDREWVMRPAPTIVPWSGEERSLFGGLRLVRCGGHFPGASILQGWRGALFTGDTIQVCPDRRSVSFMYSYPNYIPLNAVQVQRILAAIEPLAFDRIYGAFPQMTIPQRGKHVIQKSARRYLQAIADRPAR
jgi:glyoxylase-like metal-dependent hydrolase (beta-lactamase superfamily II)